MLAQNLVESRSPCFSTCSKLAPAALRTVERRAKTIGFGVRGAALRRVAVSCRLPIVLVLAKGGLKSGKKMVKAGRRVLALVQNLRLQRFEQLNGVQKQ